MCLKSEDGENLGRATGARRKLMSRISLTGANGNYGPIYELCPPGRCETKRLNKLIGTDAGPKDTNFTMGGEFS